MNAADDAANGISVADDAPERPVNKTFRRDASNEAARIFKKRRQPAPWEPLPDKGLSPFRRFSLKGGKTRF